MKKSAKNFHENRLIKWFANRNDPRKRAPLESDRRTREFVPASLDSGQVETSSERNARQSGESCSLLLVRSVSIGVRSCPLLQFRLSFRVTYTTVKCNESAQLWFLQGETRTDRCRRRSFWLKTSRDELTSCQTERRPPRDEQQRHRVTISNWFRLYPIMKNISARH